MIYHCVKRRKIAGSSASRLKKKKKDSSKFCSRSFAAITYVTRNKRVESEISRESDDVERNVGCTCKSQGLYRNITVIYT